MHRIPLLLLLPCLAFAIQDGQPDAERDFGFAPLEIYKFTSGTRQLTVSDIDLDGRDDIAFLNVRRSRIEILLSPDPAGAEPADGLPALKDRFTDRGTILDQQVFTYRFGDMNGDHKPDLVTFGAPIGLQIRFQQEEGRFGPPLRVYVENREDVVAVWTADFDEDGRDDIAVGSRDGALLLWNNAEHPFRNRSLIPYADDSCSELQALDIDGDTHQDLLLYFNGSPTPLRARPGDGTGRFGLEHPMEVPPMRFMQVLRAGDPSIVCVLRDGIGLRVYRFDKRSQAPILDTRQRAVRSLPLQGAGKSGAPAWLVLDLSGDDMDDIILAAPTLSQLHLYAATDDGLANEPRRIDTLSGVDSISPMQNGDLLVVSRSEKAAAIHAAARLTEFPAVLPLEGDVVAGTALKVSNTCYFVCRDKDRKLRLVAWQNGQAKDFALDLRDEPSAMTAFSLKESGTGMLLFMPFAPPRMFLLAGDELAPVETSAFRALSETLEPGRFRLVRPGDGTQVVVAHGRTARTYRWNNGRYEITRQMNPGNERAEVVATCEFQPHGGDPGVMLFDRNTRKLAWYTPHSETPDAEVHLANASRDLTGLVQLRHPSRNLLVLTGPTALNVLSDGVELITLESGPEYMSPSEDPSLHAVEQVALGRPPRRRLAVADGANRTIEIVSVTPDGISADLVFPVFLDPGFSDGNGNGREPHAVAAGDLDGDGAGDMVLLVHDRLLIYMGE